MKKPDKWTYLVLELTPSISCVNSRSLHMAVMMWQGIGCIMYEVGHNSVYGLCTLKPENLNNTSKPKKNLKT